MYAVLLEIARLARMLVELGNNINRIERKLDEHMATTNTTAAALSAKLTAIEASLTSIRGDVTGLKAKIAEILAAGGISQLDADALLAQATRIATSAAVLDGETPESTPAA